MNIKPLASGSTGNCYLIDDGHTKILLEAGISWKRIQKALDFKTHDLAGVIASHGHGDHLGHAKEAMKAGIDVYCGQQAADMQHLEGHRLDIIKAGEQFKIGTWTILVFDAVHDVETFGYVLGTEDGERLLYLTDTGYSLHRFQGLTHIMVECNHLEEKLSENILNGSIPAVAGRRTRRSHMSLERVITMLKSNDLSNCRAIYLLHLSNGNSDEKRMIQEVQKATGIPTYACAE